jgi:hypothetical protein
VTQPARNNPRAAKANPTAQITCFVAADVKLAAKAAAHARGEKLRAFVERALRSEIARETTADS